MNNAQYEVAIRSIGSVYSGYSCTGGIDGVHRARKGRVPPKWNSTPRLRCLLPRLRAMWRRHHCSHLLLVSRANTEAKSVDTNPTDRALNAHIRRLRPLYCARLTSGSVASSLFAVGRWSGFLLEPLRSNASSRVAIESSRPHIDERLNLNAAR